MPAGFPQEIVDMIVDYLHDDPKALAQCSLVSRDWLPRCHLHKFSNMRIDTYEDMHRWRKILCALPSYADYITSFVNCKRQLITPYSPIPFEILSRLSNLRTVSIDSIHLRDYFDSSAAFVSLQLASVRFLAVGPIIADTCSDILRFIFVFPNLDTLHISGIAYHNSESSKTLATLFADGRMIPKLKHLKCVVQQYFGAGFCCLLAKSPLIIGLETLVLGWHSTDVEPLCELLDACGASLTTLNILYRVIRTKPLSSFSNFSSCVSLQHLNLTVAASSESPSDFQWLNSALDTINSREMRRCCICVELDPGQIATKISQKLHQIDWNKLNGLSNSLGSPPLLDIVVKGVDHHVELFELIGERLPRLRDLGVLRITSN